MTENERIKELRKARGLTLEQFGERLGVGKSAISKIERAETSVTDQMRRSISREFCVREEWLRDGEGTMESADLRSVSIQEAVNRLMTGETAEFKRRLVVALSALDESQWIFLRRKMEEIVGVASADEEDEAQELARQIIEDKKAEAASSASDTAAG
jgi:transcriptional regulator with XRE-family HTH domain